ncbi:MAG: hypothetical protein CL678_07015 [Bdellovibrionaceae bacterium]|nr:hypothetical protein [Pseudobdellovibrionaceae bacterium]|tara:strand:+ start:3053 stop:4534 length:1482 start_codon:yes stop_codon:yes gene_type:complete
MAVDFTYADHTVILSDLHLSDAEPPHPGNPLWKRYKRPKHFIDKEFRDFLTFLSEETSGATEIVLNGDIFDFDSVMVNPEEKGMKISWLEKKRGLFAEEKKSIFKMSTILKDHWIWIESLGDFVRKGNRVVFVIGNHDMEVHWPGVQKIIVDAMKIPDSMRNSVRFCEWFYVSNKDTLIEHGNQYDAYCTCSNPIHPLVRKGGRYFVRLPFGNLAGKFMLNGMGLFNPHVDSSYIKSNLTDYLVFFYKYLVRVQPLIMFTWFWGAAVTLFYSIGEGLLPAVRDPLKLEKRLSEIATKANSSVSTLHSLRALHVHPAIFNPIRIARELWLDRAILLGFAFLLSFWIFSTVNLFAKVSMLWWAIPLALFLPALLFYARSVESEVYKVQTTALKRVNVISKITGLKRVVFGHTHRERHILLDGVEVLNTGTWSPAFHDVECTQPFGRKCFAWIKKEENSSERVAELYEWNKGKAFPIPRQDRVDLATLEMLAKNRT